MFRVCVCGGRDYMNRTKIFEALSYLHAKRKDMMVISGGATGADWIALEWAKKMNVPCVTFLADWKTHGKAAGPIRNKQMVDAGINLLLAFPGGRGTANMIEQSRAANVQVFTVTDADYLGPIK